MSGRFIKWFEEIGKRDVALVGGKCANLGELANKADIPTLPGFSITAKAYRYFIEKAGISEFIRKNLEGLDTHNIRDLTRRSSRIRRKIIKSKLPEDLEKEIIESYRELGRRIGIPNPYVAVRSSATAEDMPGASFAGQQETYLNVEGERNLINNVKKCFASLFTSRSISYRVDKGFDHLKVSLSIGVQKMGRSDIGSSGVMFTIDPDSGLSLIHI